MALPTFLVIGAAKAGTTSLHHYLDQHPEVQMSSIKETHFFSGPENGYPYTKGRVESLQQYEKLFDPAMRARGESSPSYAGYPRRDGVPERIRELIPEARIVYLVRDPIARSVSHHHHRVAMEGERRSLSEAFADLTDPYAPCTGPSLYGMQLERYLSCFPQEHVLVVDHADLRADRRSTLAEIFGLLSVDSTFDSKQFDQELYKSEGRRVYPPGPANFIERNVVPRLQWLPASLRTALRRTGERTLLPELQDETLTDDLRARLEDFFAADVHRLRELTGKTFSTWSL